MAAHYDLVVKLINASSLMKDFQALPEGINRKHNAHPNIMIYHSSTCSASISIDTSVMHCMFGASLS